jgi:mycofactocin glycosyltransferase
MEPTRNSTLLDVTAGSAAGLARAYQLDGSTRIVAEDADETTLLGGSPLRLFRLTAAGRRLFDDIAGGGPVGPSRLTERLLESGAIHPVRPESSASTRHQFQPADVTVVVPTHETAPTRLYEILRHCVDTAGVMFVDDGSGTPLSGVRGATLVRLRHNSGPAAGGGGGGSAA